jgi:hypothetical protein
MEEENVVNPGGVSNKIPFPSIPNNPGNQVPGELPSAREAFMQLAEQNRFKGAQNIPVSSFYSGGSRYEKTRPFTDFEEMAAQQQSGFDQVRNALGKGLGIAATSFVSGTVGLLNGIGSSIANQKFSKLYDNPTTQLMDRIQTGMEDYAPNYYRKAETDAEWWQSDNLLTPNFWADKVIKNVGYGVGSIGGALAWTKVFSLIGKANALVRLGKGAETAATIEKAMQVVPKAQKLSAIEGALANLSQGVKSQIANNGQRTLTSVMGTFGEASVESLQSSNKFRTNAIAEYRRQNGIDPTGKDLDDINASAEKVGNYVWGMGTLLLSASNYIQLPKILGSSRKVEKAFINDLTQEGLGKEFVERSAKTRFGKIVEGTKGISRFFVQPTEALEEGMQFAIASGVDDYFNRAYTNREELGTFLETVYGAMGNVFGEGIEKTLSEKEGIESILIGSLAGGIQQAPMSIYREGLTGTGGQRKRNTDIALKQLNETNIEAALKDQANFLAVGIGSQTMRTQAIENNDILSEKDYEADYSLSYLMPRAKYGKMESVYNELSYYKEQASNPQGFAELQTAGIAFEKESSAQFIQRISNLENISKAVEKHYDNINETYSGVYVTDDKGDIINDANGKPIRKYSPAVIDRLVYAASKIDDYSARIPALTSVLSSAGVNVSTILNDVLVSEKPTAEAVKESIDQIDAMDVVVDVKDNLKKSLSDLIEMSLRRKMFINEYKEIKDNPFKYTREEKKPDTVIPEEKIGERVTIVTKDGEKNYEVGTEYFLGKVVEYDASGNEVYRFPKLTIIGQNPDGTIRIRDNKGERDINPEVLKDYKLGKVSAVANNPEASFYMENINTIVEWNMGKDKGGVKKGRLEFDSETNQLMFTYVTTDKKGKRFVKSIQVDLKSFEPKPGFEKAVFSLGRELTATEKEQIKKSKEKKATQAANTLYDLNAQDARAQLINDYHAEVIEKQAQVEKTIKEKKADILTIEEELEKVNKVIEKGGEDARAKKGTRLKSTVRKALSAAMRLSRAKEDLLQEVADLEAQREEGELILAYLQDAVQNISELSGDAKSIIDQLEFETELLKESIEENGKQISALTKLANQFEDALDSAISFLRNLVNQFEINYPKVPRILGAEFNEFLKTNPNFLKLKPSYVSDLRELDRLIAETEDMEIFPNEEALAELNDKIKSLKENLQTDANELIFKQELLAKMKKAYQEYQASGIEEEKLMKNEALKKQILGTADNDNPVAPVFDREFEVDDKKPLAIVPRATMGIDRGKPHQKRAQRFGMNFPSFDNDQKRNIKGVYITSKNQDQLIPGLMDFLRTDENGVNETVDPNTIIAMVMVDMSTGEPVLVGENGEALTEEQLQDPLNNSIYQVFPLEKLQWSGEYDNKSMFADNVSENTRSEVRKQYAEWRSRVLKVEDLSEVHSIDVSFGRPKVNQDTEGKKLYDTKTGVEEAGLVTDYDIDNSPIITVATSDESIIRGISVTKSAPGRVFLDMGNGLVPLKNRQHSKQEAEVIFNAIVQFSKNLFDKTKGVNDDQSRRLISYLKSVVYWGIPANDPGFSSVFFKDGKLFMSGKDASFPFTPSGLLQNKDSIITVLTGMYHNVNGAIAREIGQEYEQITNISEDGTIQSVTWPNYQSYLLSTTTPDGKKRSGEQLPLSTYMRPLEGPNDVNRSGIYFYTTDTVDDYIIPENKKETKLTPVKTAAPATATNFILDGSTPNELVSPKTGRVILFAAPSQNPTLDDIQIFRSDDLDDVIAEFESKGEDPSVAIKQMVLKSVQKQIQSQQESPTSSKAEKGRARLFGSGKTSTEAVDEEVEEVETPRPADKGRARLFGKTPPSTNVNDEADQLSEEIDRTIKPTKRSNRAEFREVVERQAKSNMTEDWNEIEAFWKKVLPGVPLYRLKNIIQATNGVQAWGMLKNGAIYVYENAEVGTFYHEVFEAVWKMFADPAEQQSIINEFKSRSGSFVDRPTGEIVKYSKATPQQIKEQLAEEFREYVLFKKVPAKPKDGRPFIVKLFSDIVNIIKKFFTGKDANINTEELFKRIGSGYYAKSIPSVGVLQDVPSQIVDIEDAFATEEDELRAITLPYKEQHEIIQQMAYKTFSLLGTTDQSLFNVANLKKSELNDILFEEIIGEIDEDGVYVNPGIVTESIFVNNENRKNKKISNAEFIALNKSLEQTRDKIVKEWEEIFNKYEEYMKQYQIEFDENDEVTLRDEHKTREINQDATKIDAFRKANSAIKLLLATLPRTTGKKNADGSYETVVTSVGGSELLPLSQTFVTVLNKLYASRDVNEMMENLRKLAEEDSNYARLYKRIAKKDATEGKFEFKKLTTPHSIQLLSSFFSTFKKQNPEVKNVFILENGDVVVGDANLSQASSQIANDFENGIILSARQGEGYFEYNAQRKAYVAKDKINSLKFNSSNIADNDNAMLRFLNDIGVEFTKEDFKKLESNDKTKFREIVKGIRDSLVQNKELMTISKKTISIQGRLTELALLKVKVSNPEIDITYFNISNERAQSHIGVNPLSDLQDFIAKTKNLGDNSVKESHYKYLVMDPFAKGSVILKKLFPKGGEKVKENNPNFDLLTVGYVGGTKNDNNGKQKPSAKLTYPERLVQEINLNLDGFYLNLVPGDASIEWMVKMGNHVSSTNMSVGYQKVMEIFKEYFKSEYELAKSVDRFVDPSRASEKNNLRFFYDILGKELNDEIIASKEVDADAVYKKFAGRIESAVKKYVESRTDSFRSTLSKYNILQYDGASFSLKNVKTSDGGMYSLSKSMNEQTLNNNLKALTVNYMIANIELHKLMYSDPYQYKDELKRIKSFSSPRQAIMSDPDNLTVGFNINAAMQNVLNAGFKKGDRGYTDFNRNYFRSVTHADVIGVVDVPGQDYDAFKETDGSGIISLKANRNLRFRAGQWTDNDELQYRHDVAYEELVKSGADQETIDKFEKNNPSVQSAYTPVKPIVAGTTDNDQGYNEIVLDKFALYPLSFRIMHKINPTSNAMKLYDKMQREDIDYIVFNSGRKVGARNPHPTYNTDGSFNDAPYLVRGNYRNVINIPFKIMAIQAEVPSKDKALVTRGSQMTKLLTMDFMAAGVPVDFMPNESNFNERYQAWNALDEKGKQQSKLYKEIQNNKQLLQEMTKFGYETLLRRLGIERVDGGYKITDFSVAATTLRDEILKREVNDNVINSLDSFLKGKTILEATPAYQQVRNILYSIVDSEVVSPKISGGMKVQIPSTLLESNKIGVQEINGKKGFVSDTLNFYEKDGERVAEVMIGRWFDSPLSDEELMDYFNNDPEGKKQIAALFGVAFRIPTQNQNSIDAIKIAKFLPKEFRDSVVIPSALVAKVGSDFDIDKLSMYLKNVYKDAKGNIKLVPFEGYGQQAIDKFKSLSREITEEKIAIKEEKILKQGQAQRIFGDIALGISSDKLAKKWIPIFRQWFANDLVDNQLPVQLIEQVFINRIEELNKNIDELTTKDLDDLFIEEHANRLYKASLENAYIESSENLIKSDENYDKLMTPNSAKQLEGLAKEIADKTSGGSYDYRNVGNMLDRNFMSSLRHAFVTGKYAIGIAAVNQTNHSLMQRFASFVDPARLNNVSSVDKKWLGDAKVKFSKFNQLDGKATMSMIKNADGQFISDIIGQFIDGYVDISNGPWIMQLGATPNVASTWLFLAKIGVPIDTITYFMNQPIVRDYLQTIENAGYSWLFIDDFVTSVSQDYASGQSSAFRNEIPNTKSLRDMVGKKASELSPSQKADQQFILGEFLKYAKMAEHMFLVTQGTNYDTSNFNDPYLLYKKHEQLAVARQTIISSVDEILDNSFVGTTAETLNETRDAAAEILASDRSKVRNVIQKVIKPYVNLSDRDFVKVAQRAVSDLFDYAVQTNTVFRNRVISTMISKGGFANDIIQMVKEIKANPNHPMFNNHVINIIVPQLAPEASPNSANNIKIKGATNKIYDQNSIIYSFRELKEYLEGKGELFMYKKFEMLALYQSGLSVNRLSFTSLLPYEDFENIYNDTIQRLEELPNLETFASLNVFERNNWANDDIVPYEKARLIKEKDGTPKYNPAMEYLPPNIKNAVKNGDIPPIISRSVLGRNSDRDFFVYSWEDNISKEKKAEMRKKGDFSYIKRGLFRRVKVNGQPFINTSNNKEYYIYQAVNAWGARERAQEFYDVEKPSEIDNGFIKVTNVAADEKIVNLFISKGVTATQAKTQVSKEGSMLLKNGKTYPFSKINSKMLEVIGYTPEQIGKILKSIC